MLHTFYNAVNALLQLPFGNQLIWLARRIVPPQKEEQRFALLDDNFLKTPPIAVARCVELCSDMAELSKATVNSAIQTVREYDDNTAKTVYELEDEVDVFEDKIGVFLVKLSGCKLTVADTQNVSRMLHAINDLERISDHARNIAESGTELHDKNLSFSDDAKAELEVIFTAVTDVTELAVHAFTFCDPAAANRIDPLEQVVDDLKSTLRDRHIQRLQRGECSTTLGFVYTDILTDLERISDHCSNVAMSVLQMQQSSFESHSYEAELKRSDAVFAELYGEYREKYRLP
jgi:phosphate:Na+ symporter